MSLKPRCLGDVVEFIRGITFKPHEVIPPDAPGAVVCMRTKNIQELLETSDLIAVPREFVRREELLLQEGDILISSANSWNLVGKVAQVPALPYSATAGGFIAIVRAKRDHIDPQFLYHWLATESSQAAIRACGRQTTSISNLSIPQFLALPIVVPELCEQQRIASIVKKVNDLRRKRQEAIRLANDFLRTVFLDMFGDPELNPKGFTKGTIRDLVRSANYGTSEKASEEVGKYPILRMNNITYEGGWNFSSLKYVNLDEVSASKYMAQKGDILFNRTNSKELVGKTAVYMEDKQMAIAGYLVRVRVNDHGNPHYIAAYLNSAHGKQILEARAKSIVGMANINAQEMQDIPLLLPPVELQNKYAAIVEAMQIRLKTHQAFSLESEALHSALSHRFFGRASEKGAELC